MPYNSLTGRTLGRVVSVLVQQRRGARSRDRKT